MRLLCIFLALATLVLIPFGIWGGFFTELFTRQGAAEWLGGFGAWAWAAGLLLMTADLVLPIPGTAVISALGYVYGFWVGGLLGALGSWLPGMVGYGLCRGLGRRAAEKIAGRADLEKGERIFGGSAGGFIVALSRWLPIMPEVVACLAGLARMPLGRFALALACGSVPLGFAFAAIGVAGHERPGLAIGFSAIVPPILWAIIHPIIARRRRK